MEPDALFRFVFGLVLGLVWVVPAWPGHAYLWTTLLNHIYGRPLPKWFLKLWRFVTGAVILALPLAGLNFPNPSDILGTHDPLSKLADTDSPLGRVQFGYLAVCWFATAVYIGVNVYRELRKPPRCVVSEQTRTLDLWPELGARLIGDGKGQRATRVPGNCAFKCDITDLTLALPHLPPAWDGLTVLLVSDLHFHGTPSRVYFERILDELTAGAAPDLVCLAGDFVDTDTHHEWIPPLLGRLNATGAKLAILGNHDRYHFPDRVRASLASAGYTVLGNTWREITVRGVRCVAVGHEGPWFAPAPDLRGAPTDVFRLCLSHTPDNFYWGIRNRIGLMLCGHVHGGGIRVPLIGSIFVPSVYARRFDQGVFEKGGTAMVVSRGLSGKEPLRIRCNPQVVRIKLIPARATSAPQ